jgi:hypothetical protein
MNLAEKIERIIDAIWHAEDCPRSKREDGECDCDALVLYDDGSME